MTRYIRLKTALVLDNTRLTHLARQFGVSQPVLTQVAQGKYRSRRVEALVDAWTDSVLRKHRLAFPSEAA